MSYKSAVDLHSIIARGQVGHQYIYYWVKGEQRRRAYVIPTDPLTPRQRSKRAFFRMGMKYWNALSDEEKYFYEIKAKKSGKPLISYNYFLSLWLRGKIVQEAVKSVQRGSTTCVAGFNDVEITEVEADKTLIVCPAWGLAAGPNGDVISGIIGATLLDSTHLRIAALKSGGAASPVAVWEVIEFY